ncbi:carbohydrate-binding module family 13 protein [Hypoxylon trugodes]|uniref:carbohydrate-binding module family 13 protein n=1 Tax=Hypoxylon trugodes TaxID=326681 RepID=UPI00219AA27A|nr:carbohydrate-binding module family 13 protein [Hypoxylon trugodes]KAI1391339.1 carbohydrate-binding module family 13 protein [Hypoxylon trugodes]
MLTTTPLLMLAFAATGFAQAPEGYRTVYITSMVDSKFVVVPKSAASGSTVVVQTGTQKPEQQWYLKTGSSKIQLAGTGNLCLDAGAQSNWKDMASISLKECSDTEDGQKWEVKEDGRIALEKSTPQECIDLQYMRATENNPVGLYSCAGLGNTGAADKGINWPLVDATSP